ncbi:MAG: C40 family peptidase [Lysobacter sp.]
MVAAARSWLHVPWRHQGRTRRGIDCVGFAVLVFGAIRPGIPDQRGYLRTPFSRRLALSLMAGFGAPVSRDELQPADVVTLANSGEEHHVAIVTDHPEGLGLIHCYARASGGPGRVVEHRLSDDWARRIVEVFRP